MATTPDALEADWVHAVFGILRDEVIALAADFGDRVKREIDVVAATRGILPPSATALLTSVAIESSNIAASLVRGGPAVDESAVDEGDGEDS